MRNWSEIYKNNADGFLHSIDFIMQHPAISIDAKESVVQAMVNDLVKPSICSRISTNPQTYLDAEKSI